MKALANHTDQQSLVEIFVQELDQIYYPGYTEELIASEPCLLYTSDAADE